MKKIILLIAFMMFTSGTLFAAVDQDGRSTSGPVARSGMVFNRGVWNIVGLPIEISSTMIRESDIHHWLWPITSLPRSVHHVFVRATSGVNDIFFEPVAVMFTNDVSPMTEPMGLPTYPWQRE